MSYKRENSLYDGPSRPRTSVFTSGNDPNDKAKACGESMNILYYDCFCGISGDMNLAAMIDLGVDPDRLTAELSRLRIDDEFTVRITHDQRRGIHGTRVDVALHNQSAGHGHHHDHMHAHSHEHTHPHAGQQQDPAQHHAHEHTHHHHDHAQDQTRHHHDPAHPQGEEHGHHHGHAGHGHGPQSHEHRNLDDVQEIINRSDLRPEVKSTALAIFRRVARAEARVHGKELHEVHFHEVGATDSIVDIVGAAICFHELKVDAVWCSPVELGGGFVHCAHGKMPVPAPATTEILAGIPTTRGAVPMETTTPTGAAILAELVDRYEARPELTLTRTGYGVGHGDPEIPNVLRVHLASVQTTDQPNGPSRAPGSPAPVPCRLLQCNLDDMTAEMLGVAMEQLLEAGAMDVHFTPIIMKKNRPATTLSLLCAEKDQNRFQRLLFRHTTTLGVKSIPLEKTVLDVNFQSLDTPLGSVTIKNALLHGRVVRSKPELEDCRKLARQHGIPLGEVYAELGRLMEKATWPEHDIND